MGKMFKVWQYQVLWEHEVMGPCIHCRHNHLEEFGII